MPLPANAEGALAQSANGARPSRGPSASRAATIASPAPNVDRRALAQGGDPYVPPTLRARPPASSPEGAALESLVRAKIAAHDRGDYR
jgi:hypothetical protein